MNIKNQKSFIDSLNEKMNQDSELSLDFFKEDCPKLVGDAFSATEITHPAFRLFLESQ